MLTIGIDTKKKEAIYEQIYKYIRDIKYRKVYKI